MTTSAPQRDAELTGTARNVNIVVAVNAKAEQVAAPGRIQWVLHRSGSQEKEQNNTNL
jgi:hypothetical protein